MPATFKLRRGPAAEWIVDNPILMAGEPGFEIDTGKIKIGTGFQVWTALPYILPAPEVSQLISDAIADATFEGVPGPEGPEGPKGDKGDKGDTGDQGIQGLKGDKGDAGNQGIQGVKGDTGNQGIQGVKGDKGDTGDPFPSPFVLTDTPTIVTDCSLSNLFEVTLGGNRTLANPINPSDGDRIVWEIVQDATGGRTLTLGSAFVFGESLPTLSFSTTSGKRDFMGAIYNQTTNKWYVVAFSKGF